MPLQKIDDFFTLFKGARYFTVCDLCSSYYHIKLDIESIPKSAFTTVFSMFEFLDYPLAFHKALTSLFILSMTFFDLARPLIKVKDQDI